MIVAVYEDNEVGAGYGLEIIDTSKLREDVPEEAGYLKAINSALANQDKHGFGGADCNPSFSAHSINHSRSFDGLGKINAELPCTVEAACYIFNS